MTTLNAWVLRHGLRFSFKNPQVAAPELQTVDPLVRLDLPRRDPHGGLAFAGTP